MTDQYNNYPYPVQSPPRKAYQGEREKQNLLKKKEELIYQFETELPVKEEIIYPDGATYIGEIKKDTDKNENYVKQG